jgi:hypothetical protein
MRQELTLELLQDKERCSVLDMFEALVLRRLRGQHPPEKERVAEVELDPEYLKRRRAEEAERLKVKEAEDVRLDALRRAVYAAGGPQRVWNEWKRREYIKQMAAQMQQRQFAFTQTGTTSGTSNNSFYNATGSGGAFFFQS